ncbi:MAG: hypothetical protein C0483_13620 [Pirellula sp.]|nr:hypothetical protein [Pirellula sp.]
MKQNFILSLAVGLLVVSGVVGCQPAGEAKKTAPDDLKNVEGAWTLVSGEVDGTAIPEQEVKNAKLTIVGDQYTVDLGEKGVKKGTQKLDATKTPKQIDAKDTEGPTVGENHGIYEFTADGDFRVCFAAPGKERPIAFVTKPGSGHFMHLWKRAK